jgi:hypothetical protein
MFMKRFAQTGTVVLAAVLLAQAGCGGGGPRTAVVRGKVTYQGKAVPNGTVMFVPKSGPSATGEIQSDGSYTLTTTRSGDGAVPGTHQVVISAVQNQGDRLPEDRSPWPAPIVPSKYSSVATTDLKAEVKDQENEINFDLQDGKK